MAELKPCPFCGGEAEKKYIRRKMGYRLFNFPHITHFVYIKCKVCGTTTAVKETIENAIEAWNKRTKPDNTELKADNERLREMWAKAVSDLSKCKAERPKGRWELYPSRYHRRCSACKVEFEKPKFNIRANFCPNCGADMRGESE